MSEKAREAERQRMVSMVVRQLRRRLGELKDSLVDEINQLQAEQIELLSEALFDFKSIDELTDWLHQKHS